MEIEKECYFNNLNHKLKRIHIFNSQLSINGKSKMVHLRYIRRTSGCEIKYF